MIACKNITKFVSVIVAAAVFVCLLALMFPQQVAETFGGSAVAFKYETELFDISQVMEIDIQMDEEKWADMLAHASEEEYYSCDVVINEETIHNVGIRPKGNTSLSSIVMDPDTDRYSFKLKFDRYVEGQTCFGLDKLILNNNYADATNMKEALVYDMYKYLEADASLYNYARISVNGRYWGVYLALEAVEDSFQLRNYGTADGKLYKPESMGMGGRQNGEMGGPGGPGAGGGAVFNREPGSSEMPEQRPDSEDGNGKERMDAREKRPDRGGMPGGGPGMGGSGADLNYTDDDLESYSTIWEGEVNDTGKKDHRRVVTALKNISEGNAPEKYMDVDNILRYMAVHVFSVNLDSLSGNMAHNYYLYEENGRLNILPWDYNLSFGGMGMGRGSNASEMINDAIDTPFETTKFFDVLLEDEEYLARYHEYLRQLTEEYVAGGKFDEFYNRVQSQIDDLVETDPTAFYTFEEYQAGAKMLYKTVKLRAESIQGQLNGTIPSTDEGQQADISDLVDASAVDIDIMGTFNGHRSSGFGGEEEQEMNPAQEVFYEQPGMPGEENEFPENLQWDDMADHQPPQRPEDFEGGNMTAENFIICGICLLISVLALILAGFYQRVPWRK